MTGNAEEHRLGVVPLFPLPNVVLFPRAVLPLHIFEHRYKAMTAAVLAGDRRLAMALLKPGWEKDYHQRPPVESVVCIGTVLEAEKLPDGNYNFLLQGQVRARIVQEVNDGRSYRRAELVRLPETPVIELDLANERQRLTWMFGDGSLSAMPLGVQIRQLLSSPMPTADVADLIAFNLLEDIPLKQSLLAECDVAHRVHRTIAALETIRPALESASRRAFRDPSAN